MDSLSVIPKVINHALEASPSNSIGYGIALALPILATIALWMDRARLYRRITELQDKLTKQSEKHLGYVKQLRDAIDRERKEKDGG